MSLSLFKKQLLLMATVTIVFLFLGFIASLMVTQIDRQRFEASPIQFMGRLVEEISTRFHVPSDEAVRLIKSANGPPSFPMSIEILDHATAARLVGENRLPGEDSDEVVEYGKQDTLHFPSRLIRLKGEREEYLSVNFKPRSSPLRRIVNAHTVVMMASIFLASLFSMFMLFYSMRTKADLAAQIISEMRSGNLNARFPVGKMDEVGKLMLEFNKMADEIQLLVETIRRTELVRIRRLQELAHDLRTPVASLKNLLETLDEHKASINSESQAEILSLSLKEVDYFARLVEDLLFLAQVTEPKYAVTKTHLNLQKLIEDELETLRARYPHIKTVTSFDDSVSDIKGDAHLLRRLFRNMFENAYSFAGSTVEISIKRKDSDVKISVRDDGPGFDEKTLASFGEKRGTRTVSKSPEGRLSVGLGSVIMKAVVTVHSGSLSARNRESGGAEVQALLSME